MRDDTAGVDETSKVDARSEWGRDYLKPVCVPSYRYLFRPRTRYFQGI